MSQSVVLVSMIEVALITLTTLLLIQPKSMFPSPSPTFKSIANWCGMFLLCVTFCWSVVVGIILSLNDFILRV